MPEKLTSWRQISDAERVFGQPIIALVSIRKTMGAIQCNGCPFAFTYKIIKSNVIYSEVSNKLISDLLKYFSPNLKDSVAATWAILKTAACERSQRLFL